MGTFIQALSWTLIYALLQGCLIYGISRVALKLIPSRHSSIRYHISLSSMIALLSWFLFTFYNEFQLVDQLKDQGSVAFTADNLVPGSYIPAAGDTGTNLAIQTLLSKLKIIFPWLSGLYIAGFLFMFVRLLTGIKHLLSFKHQPANPPQPFHLELLRTACTKLSIRKPIRLHISAHIAVPMLIGFLKPVILLPASLLTQLNTEELESILLHELAHIKRHDYLVNILQSIAETVLFFNPFAWLIAANIRREREHCCDDLVLQANTTAISYASALAAIADRQADFSKLVVAASGRPHVLYRRIQRIMEEKKSPLGYSRMVAALLLIIIMGAGSTFLSPVFAQIKKVVPPAQISKAKKQTFVARQQKKDTIVERKTSMTTPSAAPVKKAEATENHDDEDKLIKALSLDGLVDEAKGFIIEKQQQKLYINGAEQSDAIAKKYLSSINKEIFRVEVYPFQERVKRHPGSNLMQVMFPVQQQSGCSDYSTPERKS